MTYQEALKSTEKQGLALPGSREEKKGLERFQDFFDNVSQDSVRRKTSKVYASECFFNDTLKTLLTARDIEEYFLKSTRFTDAFFVRFEDTASSGPDHYLRWIMEIRMKFFLRNRTFRSSGMSHIRLDPEGKILLHQDFWDAAGNFFQYIPGLGSGISLVKRLV